MNRKRKCKFCGNYTPDFIKVPAGSFCSMDHAVKFAMDQKEKIIRRKQQAQKRKESEQAKAARAKHRADKEGLKSKSALMKEAQAAFNKYVRIRDFFDPCISCGASKAEIEQAQGWKIGGCWDAGHYKSRGAKPNLRFHLWNVHKQCKSCNAGAGKYAGKNETLTQQYEVNLIEKIGAEKVDFLNSNNELREFTPEYLRRIKKVFNKKARTQARRNTLEPGATNP